MRNNIINDIVKYFSSSQWVKFNSTLREGTGDIYHAHIYTDTCISPFSLRTIVEEYYKKYGNGLSRKPRLYPEGKGMANIYAIHPNPVETAYFEIFLRFTPDVIFAESPPEFGEKGNSTAYWDKIRMDQIYKGYSFKAIDDTEKGLIMAYFESPYWKKVCEILTTPGYLHAHANIFTSVHPKIIMEIGCEVMSEQGWDISKTVSIVFRNDEPKIVFLISEPNVVFELGWTYQEGTLIKPNPDAISWVTTEDMFNYELAQVPYLITLTEDEIRLIVKNL